MREPQKVERLRLAEPAPLSAGCRVAAELEQAGLGRMQAQRELLQPLGQFRLEPDGFGLVLEAGDDVVG